MIGGLGGVATITTLFFVPIMYTVMRRKHVDPFQPYVDEAEPAS